MPLNSVVQRCRTLGRVAGFQPATFSQTVIIFIPSAATMLLVYRPPTPLDAISDLHIAPLYGVPQNRCASQACNQRQVQVEFVDQPVLHERLLCFFPGAVLKV